MSTVLKKCYFLTLVEEASYSFQMNDFVNGAKHWDNCYLLMHKLTRSTW